MKYIAWLWRNSCGIRWNTAVRIVTGVIQVALGLMMVWLSRRFIDETIRTGTADEVLHMVIALVATVVGAVVLRQIGYWLTTTAGVHQTNALRLRIFSSLFRRQKAPEFSAASPWGNPSKQADRNDPARFSADRPEYPRRF